ncbi:hypothetical protein RUM43_008324 [Polyplax serrata]|uniref:Uncharacterized protein n=1 Tax=Polyplax serrata TaxID=468196 RepID=A0AAN8PNW7_POLSC
MEIKKIPAKCQLESAPTLKESEGPKGALCHPQEAPQIKAVVIQVAFNFCIPNEIFEHRYEERIRICVPVCQCKNPSYEQGRERKGKLLLFIL